jgi:multiple sugar transport system permease protein
MVSTPPRRRGWTLVNVGFFVAVVVVILTWAFPFVWMLLGSFKPTHRITANEFVLFFTPTLDHYREIFVRQPFARFLLNSIIVAVSATVITVTAGSLAAYSMSRFRTGGRWFELWVLMTRMVPPVVLLIPLFLLFRVLGLINTLTALVIADTTFLLSFVIWIMRSFYDEVPPALDEAAMIDGASRIQAFRHVVLPVAIPGLITSTILTFIFAWNEYLFAIVYATATSSKTLPAAAADFVTGYAINWGPIFASGTLIVLPVFILSVVLQKYITRGLTLGAVK